MNNNLQIEKDNIGFRASQQQRKASNPENCVWVEASAGTGKTKVLSDRVLRLLLQGVPPSKILCLTYTKAASVEMSNRISKRLSDWVSMDKAKLEVELKDLLGAELKEKDIIKARRLFATLLDAPINIRIQTLHSFCQEVLKRFPLEAKISPYFEVLDDQGTKEILDSIKKEILTSDDIADSITFLSHNLSESSFAQIIKDIINNRNQIAEILHNYKDFAKELEQRLEVDFEPQLSLDIEVLKQSYQKENYNDLKAIFFTQKNEVRAKLKDEEKNIAYEFEKYEQKLTSLLLYKSTMAVVKISQKFIDAYTEHKRLNAQMDYEDLIFITKTLLEKSDVADWVLFKLDGGIDHILIDEAQDTSPYQWSIIKSISEEFFASKNQRTVFVVGDRKQSIYSFQGADPKKFEEMRKYFLAKSTNFTEINLEVSFRSTDAILQNVNNVFSQPLTQKGVVIDGQSMTHIPFRIGDSGKVELWDLIEPIEGENPNIWLPPIERSIGDSTSSRLAKQIAQKIKTLVSNNEILASKNRPIRYSDFLILVQRRNAFVEEIVRECKNIGVEIAGVDKIKLLEQICIQDLISIAKFLLLPSDDLTLATILKSPLFGLDDDDLFRLCYKRKNTLWNSLRDNHSYKDIYDVLQNLLKMADFVRPYELYSYILNNLEGRKKIISRLGLEALDGLDEFINLTLSFEKEHIPSLQNFIAWIEKDDIEIKRQLEQGDLDAVRIMTVHGSKGLQAPIVILPDTIRVPLAKKEATILLDDIFYYPLNSSFYEKNCLKVYEKNKEAMIEEYQRLLYVALTRAEDRLCICGYVKKQKAKENCWYESIKNSIKELPLTQEENAIVLSTPQLAEPKSEKSQNKKNYKLENYDWIYQTAPKVDALEKPYAPSKLESTEDDEEEKIISPIAFHNGQNRFQRGLIIHKLLQFLPEIKENKAKIISQFLAKNAPNFDDKKIIKEILELLDNPEIAPIFGKNSKAEVAIQGQVEDKIISGVIDRLVVLEDKVMIIDFKTNRPAATKVVDVPKAYLRQLAAYKSLVSNIYPNKDIKTYLLWTDTQNLMLIDN